MNKKKTSVSIELGGKTVTFETGVLAPQATAAVFARLGDTAVLVTVVTGGVTALDYFPLSVEYGERLYAGGKIKGSRWVKREGRPSDEAILAGRLIDRSIRPLFPKAFKQDVQVIVTVLSVDGENEPDILALNAVSAALAISKIPWAGPVGAIRMGYSEAGEYIYNPTATESLTSQLDIVVSQTKDKTVMIEAGALQVSEEIVLGAIEKAHKDTQAVIAGIEDFVKQAGQEKLPVPQDVALAETIALFEKSYKEEVAGLIAARVSKEGSGTETDDLLNKVFEEIKMKDPETQVDKKVLANALEYVMFKLIRSDVVGKKKRPDGRKIDELREIIAEIDILPRTHGSALFNRGITQALSVVTLGSPRMELLIESAEGEETKRYIHHYSGLPYSFGQTGRVGTPSRREIGHGALAERALKAVIPAQEDFPYTIRVVSEVLSQNGSSSMASTCGSTLALMAAGVPIIAPVAGISIGMMSDEKDYVLLTDIIGLEDFSGDMDFKVAGTEKGITAIQLDVKIPGLTDKQVKEILPRAREARLKILDIIKAAIPAPKETISEYAPKIEVIQIPVEKIGEVIGPSGKNIKAIIAQTGAQVDIEDDGSVTISGVDQEAVQKAVDWVAGMTREVVPGEVFEGTVKRILPFGAFVEYLPGKEGMVHVSKMRREFVNDPNDVVAIGDTVTVKVEEKDSQGRINLTMLLDSEPNDQPRQPREPRDEQPVDGGFDRPREKGTYERTSFGNRSGGGRGYGGSRGGGRGFSRGGQGRDDRGTGTPSTHPLARQFQRENREQQGKTRFGPRKPRFQKRDRDNF
ncbi:MAG TPA: polyribonucleotide nucleotidyltransferase [Patescibacteria group bacterium]|nr:polyribonucleotide nucleotidyltransferase [Patescibacteria group bacterium]